MVITPHALAGAALAGRRVLPALFLGVASHYVLDRVPHRDYDGDRAAFLALDGLTAVSLLATSRATPAQWAGALGGILPDLACVFQARVRPTRVGAWQADWHARNHARTEPSAAASVAGQVLVVIAARLLLGKARSRRRANP